MMPILGRVIFSLLHALQTMSPHDRQWCMWCIRSVSLDDVRSHVTLQWQLAHSLDLDRAAPNRFAVKTTLVAIFAPSVTGHPFLHGDSG